MTSEISLVQFFVWLLNFKIKPSPEEWYESWNYESSPKWLNLKMELDYIKNQIRMNKKECLFQPS